MDILFYLGIFVVSLFVLLRASDWFVDAAESIGLSLGIPHFIIGVTIIAFGTSLPELATSVAAVLSGNSEIVVGNVIGSNITNIALVLGLVAIYAKRIDLEYNIWHIDMPFLWGSAFMLWFVLYDYEVSILEVFILLLGIVIFLIYSLKKDEEKGDLLQENHDDIKVTWRTYTMLVIGLALVWGSADYTIFAIQKLSEMAGINPEIIALSAVALGTSLPEIIVSLNAARKGKTAMAVGNVLGSNIFNTYVVMSIPAFFGKLKIPVELFSYYLPMMIVMTILFGIMSNNKKITRWEGAILVLFYLIYMASIIQGA
ncbi:MAG: calcium/sodium antiporter [Saprospiraceae bacterium]|nr:calcium/sodium antiporter [Saprospiraceae bacterium]MCB9324561.1 calcium/sodium antiporter [Lewinellaceae bacterium]